MINKIKDIDKIKDFAINQVVVINVFVFLMGVFLYVTITALIPSTPIHPAFITLIVGLVPTYLLSEKYVRPPIESWVDLEVDKKIKPYQEKFYELPLDALERENFELVYALQKIYKSVKQLNLQDIQLDDRLLESTLEIDNKIREYGQEKELYDQAVEELLESDKKKYLKGLTRTAIEESLNIKFGDERYPEIFNSIYAYLYAWLIYSIKYHRCMPIDLVLVSPINAKNHIKVIKHIKDEILNEDGKEILIPSDKSREIIKLYLNKLINLISKNI